MTATRVTTCPTCRLVTAADAARILDDAPGVMAVHLHSERTAPSGPSCARHAVFGGRETTTDTGLTPPCAECTAPNLDACLSRQAKVKPEDRHHYVPVARP